jgi:hypothetical protein
MIDKKQFLELIIKPALDHLGANSKAAEELLLGTALQESRLTYIKQLGNGPALGVFQMEPATHDDIWNNFLKFKSDLRTKVSILASTANFKNGAVHSSELIWNLKYAAAMCRVHYLRVPEKLPAAGDIQAQAQYWKKYYNTHLGRGTAVEYMHNWRTA